MSRLVRYTKTSESFYLIIYIVMFKRMRPSISKVLVADFLNENIEHVLLEKATSLLLKLFYI